MAARLGSAVAGAGTLRLARSGSVAAKLRKSCSPSKSFAAFAARPGPWARGRQEHSAPRTADRSPRGRRGIHKSSPSPSAGHGMSREPFSLRECGWMQGNVRLKARSKIIRRDGRLQAKARHLTQRMNPGIGAAGALGQRSFAGHAPQRRLQFALDCGFARLHLPAAEICAVIGQSQLPGLRIRRGFQSDRS